LADVCEQAEVMRREDAELTAMTTRVVSDSLETRARQLAEDKLRLQAESVKREEDLQKAWQTLQEQGTVSEQRCEGLQKDLDTAKEKIARDTSEHQRRVEQLEQELRKKELQIFTLKVSLRNKANVTETSAAKDEMLQALRAELNKKRELIGKLQQDLSDTQSKLVHCQKELHAAVANARQVRPIASTLSEEDLAKQIAAMFLQPVRKIPDPKDKKRYCLKLMVAFHPDKNPCEGMATKVTQEMQNHASWKD
jgi:chromosome segregation ATPase